MASVAFNRVEKIYPDGTQAVFALDLTIEDGELLCVLGPSGCGKSSTLRMLAGLETVSRGDIVVDGTRVNDVPPQRRDMAMVFENYALYPHLNVFENLATPLRAQRLSQAEIRRRVHEVAETLRISEHLRRKPRVLSGGQRQRVGLGRAIIRTPRIFLMDEPLGHLEAYLRVELRAELRRLHERLGATTFYITHDQEEAAAISDRIAIMQGGRLQQTGTLDELSNNPINRFVAEFIGDLPMNVVKASLAGGDGQVQLPGADLTLPAESTAHFRGAEVSRAVELGVRPRDLVVHGEPGPDRLPSDVLLLEPLGDLTVIIADTPAGQMSATVASRLAPDTGDRVHLGFDTRRVHLFDGAGVSLLHRVPG